MLKSIFVWLYQTFLNKTTASSAVGSGSVILVLFSTLSNDIKKVDAKVDTVQKEVITYVDGKHDEVMEKITYSYGLIDTHIQYTNKSIDVLNGKVDILDQRIYEIKKSR